MKRVLSVFIVGFIFYIVYVQALECGITESMGEHNIQDVLRRCVPKKGEPQGKSNKNGNDTSESSEESDAVTSRKGLNSRTRRDTITSDRNDQDDQSEHNKNDTTVSDKCILQCIFANLDMVDDNGYPNQLRVAQGLLKNVQGRELRDFIQDSTDECFQLMKQGDKLESCEYATHLVTCLAEKGRTNCADWQATNLPFHD